MRVANYDGPSYYKDTPEALLKRNKRNNPRRMWVGGEYITADHPHHTPGRFDSWADVPRTLHKYVDADSIPDDDPPPKQPEPPKIKAVPEYREYGVKQSKKTNLPAIRNRLNHNNKIIHGHCELTGAPWNACQSSHILAVKFACSEDGTLLSIGDQSNTIFVITQVNDAMERVGHYLGLAGNICVHPDYDRLDILETLGIYNRFVEMTPERELYAYLHMEAIGVV